MNDQSEDLFDTLSLLLLELGLVTGVKAQRDRGGVGSVTITDLQDVAHTRQIEHTDWTS